MCVCVRICLFNPWLNRGASKELYLHIRAYGRPVRDPKSGRDSNMNNERVVCKLLAYLSVWSLGLGERRRGDTATTPAPLN